MKAAKIVFLICLLLPGISNARQNELKEEKVPETIKVAFSEKYPGVEIKRWRKKQSTFIARFSDNGKRSVASFNADGNWVQTEIRIKWNELPNRVQKTYYSSDFRWLNWNWVKKIQTSEYKEIYQIEGDNSNEESSPLCKFRLWFTPDGKMIKEESDC